MAQTEVTVAFEGGKVRTYTGPDALANAKEFVSKRPEARKILKGAEAEKAVEAAAEPGLVNPDAVVPAKKVGGRRSR